MLSVCAAPFARELHLLVHEHDPVQQSYVAHHDATESEQQPAGTDGHSNHFQDSHSDWNADFVTDCYLCKLLSQRLLAIIERDARLLAAAFECPHTVSYRSVLVRCVLVYHSRGPPLAV